jgi:hypothetical protein
LFKSEKSRIKAEKLSYILSFQTLSGAKRGKVIKLAQSLLKTLAHKFGVKLLPTIDGHDRQFINKHHW